MSRTGKEAEEEVYCWDWGAFFGNGEDYRNYFQIICRVGHETFGEFRERLIDGNTAGTRVDCGIEV